MKKVLIVLAFAFALGGCQWASFTEHFKQSPMKLEKVGEGRRETRTERTVHWRYWQGQDGKWYIEPVIIEKEVPNVPAS